MHLIFDSIIDIRSFKYGNLNDLANMFVQFVPQLSSDSISKILSDMESSLQEGQVYKLILATSPLDDSILSYKVENLNLCITK